jgi:hypothetical protein
METEFLASAQQIKKPQQQLDKPDWRSLIHPLPPVDPAKFDIQVDLLGHSKTWKVNKDRAWDQITLRSGLDPKITMVLLNDKEWTGDRQIHPGDKITFRTITPINVGYRKEEETNRDPVVDAADRSSTDGRSDSTGDVASPRLGGSYKKHVANTRTYY